MQKPQRHRTIGRADDCHSLGAAAGTNAGNFFSPNRPRTVMTGKPDVGACQPPATADARHGDGLPDVRCLNQRRTDAAAAPCPYRPRRAGRAHQSPPTTARNSQPGID